MARINPVRWDAPAPKVSLMMVRMVPCAFLASAILAAAPAQAGTQVTLGGALTVSIGHKVHPGVEFAGGVRWSSFRAPLWWADTGSETSATHGAALRARWEGGHRIAVALAARAGLQNASVLTNGMAPNPLYTGEAEVGLVWQPRRLSMMAGVSGEASRWRWDDYSCYGEPTEIDASPFGANAHVDVEFLGGPPGLLAAAGAQWNAVGDLLPAFCM